jgi:hypothetical protein
MSFGTAGSSHAVALGGNEKILKCQQQMTKKLIFVSGLQFRLFIVYLWVFFILQHTYLLWFIILPNCEKNK